MGQSSTHALIFAGGLFLGMLVLLETGRRIGTRGSAREAERSRQGAGMLDGAVFALLGLLIAFTFSGAGTRFDEQRQLVVEEANAIGTAWLRLDLLPAGAQPALRELFRRYLDSRIATYKELPDVAAAKMALAHSLQLQGEIWNSAVAACRDSGAQSAPMLLLPALNQMIDITTTRAESALRHPPMVIFVMIAALSLTASLLAGFDMAGGKSRSRVHIFGFAVVMAVTVYVILDLEYPRLGLIRMENSDQVLSQLREGMSDRQ
jgi:hypothetical protein